MRNRLFTHRRGYELTVGMG